MRRSACCSRGFHCLSEARRGFTSSVAWATQRPGVDDYSHALIRPLVGGFGWSFRGRRRLAQRLDLVRGLLASRKALAERRHIRVQSRIHVLLAVGLVTLSSPPTHKAGRNLLGCSQARVQELASETLQHFTRLHKVLWALSAIGMRPLHRATNFHKRPQISLQISKTAQPPELQELRGDVKDRNQVLEASVQTKWIHHPVPRLVDEAQELASS